MRRRIDSLALPLALLLAGALACRRQETAPTGIVHLADQLAGASVVSEPPRAPQTRLWSFDQPRPDWRLISYRDRPDLATVELVPLADAHRLALTRSPTPRHPFVIGGLAVELGELHLDDWEAVHVRARCRERLAGISIAYNLDDPQALPDFMLFIASNDEAPPVFSDGSVQTYAIPLRRREQDQGTTLRSLAVLVGAPGPGSIDILSVTLAPRGGVFDQAVAARAVTRQGTTRHTLYAHAPATLSFPLTLGEAPARLDLAFAVEPGQTVTYGVAAERDGERLTLLEETMDDPVSWRQRSVDLSALADEESRLVLTASSPQAGAVALWGAPMVSGGPRAADPRPNVVFYVIDGAGADLMSLYGYQRDTTPFLERLAAEAVVFERAYSNATWTQPSTVSFMTSLQHSVLGGLRRGVHSTPVPSAAVTMPEHFRRAGYATASFTANPNAARLVGLERGVDLLRDVETESHSTSSSELHERFWQFRAAYPGGPWFVHFQTTDVHEPNEPVPPFRGRFVSAEQVEQLNQWEGRIWQTAAPLFGTTSIAAFVDRALELADIPRQPYFETRRGLYDETMAYQDRELERFVAQLRKSGEWDDTILVVAADHGHPAGTFTRFGRGLLDPQPEPWQGGLFESYLTRVPLLVIWPGRLQGGRLITDPVSMIDVLPTLLELAGLPAAEVQQGQSLAPLLRGERMRVRPVVLDEFRVDEATGELVGNLELIDGRWGATLEIGPTPPGTPPGYGRRSIPAGGRWGAVHPFFPEVPRLLLYDLERDPLATRAVNAEHPELVEKYRRILERQWQAHRALAKRFGEAGEAAISPEQLQQLRALGYIQ